MANGLNVALLVIFDDKNDFHSPFINTIYVQLAV